MYEDENGQITFHDVIRNTLDAVLLWAIEKNNETLARICLEIGANPAVANKKGENILMQVIKNENMALFEKIMTTIENTDNNITIIDAQDMEGNTALMYAMIKTESLCCLSTLCSWC